eukprot:4784844-Lingulodinium_polyedra.AAC.1
MDNPLNPWAVLGQSMCMDNARAAHGPWFDNPRKIHGQRIDNPWAGLRQSMDCPRAVHAGRGLAM